MSEIETLAKGLTGEHLRILDALASDQKLGLATRNQDRLRRTLRTRGLIAYCGKPVRWQLSPLGIQVRDYLKGRS